MGPGVLTIELLLSADQESIINRWVGIAWWLCLVAVLGGALPGSSGFITGAQGGAFSDAFELARDAGGSPAS